MIFKKCKVTRNKKAIPQANKISKEKKATTNVTHKARTNCFPTKTNDHAQ